MARAAGRYAWLQRLPALVEQCAEQWSLEIGEQPLRGGNVALVASASRDDRPVVLKISFPDEESEHEADALAPRDRTEAARRRPGVRRRIAAPRPPLAPRPLGRRRPPAAAARRTRRRDGARPGADAPVGRPHALGWGVSGGKLERDMLRCAELLAGL